MGLNVSASEGNSTVGFGCNQLSAKNGHSSMLGRSPASHWQQGNNTTTQQHVLLQFCQRYIHGQSRLVTQIVVVATQLNHSSCAHRTTIMRSCAATTINSNDPSHQLFTHHVPIALQYPLRKQSSSSPHLPWPQP